MVGVLHWITLIDGDAEVESSFHGDVELVEEVVELKDLMDHVCNTVILQQVMVFKYIKANLFPVFAARATQCLVQLLLSHFFEVLRKLQEIIVLILFLGHVHCSRVIHIVLGRLLLNFGHLSRRPLDGIVRLILVLSSLGLLVAFLLRVLLQLLEPLLLFNLLRNRIIIFFD